MKQKHLKAAACAALAASMLLPCAQPVRAAESTEVPVTISYAASQAVRAPSVLIPKEIRMKDETSCDYSVWAYCETSELDSLFDHVTVEPDSSFVLTNERTGDTFTASVTQRDTQFLADDVKNGEAYDMDGVDVMRKGTEGTISVDGIPEGRWTGAMTFYVNEVQHHHDYIVPLMSADSLRVDGYACECGETALHNHEWIEAIYRTEGYGAGKIIEFYRCPCGETITGSGYGKLAQANLDLSDTIMNAWISKNITPGMTELEKAKAVYHEITSWTYGETQGYEIANVSRKADCLGSSRMFEKYCAAIGVRAEPFDATQLLGVEKHWMSYVWIDGEQCVADPTAGGGYFPDTIITLEGFDLFLDWLDGYVTDEEYDMWIGDYEM